MTRAMYTGSFDPVTYGHIDIITRAACMFDELIVAVLKNSEKTPLFSIDERVKMLKEVTKDIPNVKVESFTGLTVDYAIQREAHTLVRGIRDTADFGYEFQIAQINRTVNPEVDTIFLATNKEYSYLSSSILKEIARYNGPLEAFAPECILEQVRAKYPNKGDNK